jgi:hypothetical protein
MMMDYFNTAIDALAEHGKFSGNYMDVQDIQKLLVNWANDEGVALKFDYGVNTTRVYLRKFS